MTNVHETPPLLLDAYTCFALIAGIVVLHRQEAR